MLLVLAGACLVNWLDDEPDRPLPTCDPYRYDPSRYGYPYRSRPPDQVDRYPGLPVLPTGVGGLPDGLRVPPTR